MKIYVSKKAQLDAQIIELLKNSKLSTTEISKALKKDKGNISKSLKRLFNNGVLDKTPDQKFHLTGYKFMEDFIKNSGGYFEPYINIEKLPQIPPDVPTDKIDEYLNIIGFVQHNHPTLSSKFLEDEMFYSMLLMDDPDLKITITNED